MKRKQHLTPESDGFYKAVTKLFEDVLYCDGADQETQIAVEVSLRYNTSYSEKVYSFCNNIFTPDGGTHMDGFRQTLSRVINAYAKDNNLIKKDDPNLTFIKSVYSFTKSSSSRIVTRLSSSFSIIYLYR